MEYQYDIDFCLYNAQTVTAKAVTVCAFSYTIGYGPRRRWAIPAETTLKAAPVPQKPGFAETAGPSPQRAKSSAMRRGKAAGKNRPHTADRYSPVHLPAKALPLGKAGKQKVIVGVPDGPALPAGEVQPDTAAKHTGIRSHLLNLLHIDNGSPVDF